MRNELDNIKSVLIRFKFIFLALAGSILVNSCSTTTFQPLYCEYKFKEIKQKDNNIPEKFTFSGSAMVSGLPTLIKGEFKDTEKIYVSSPFGKNILSIEKKENNLCVKASNFQSCNWDQISSLISLYLPQATPLVDINFLKSIVSKKFNIKENEDIECDENYLKVKRPSYTLFYQNGELKKIQYKEYTAEYNVDEIDFTNNGQVLMRMKISSINFEK